MKVYKFIAAILLAVIIAGSIVTNTKIRALNNTVGILSSAKPDTVVQIDSTLYKAQVEKTKTIKLQNEKLSDLVNKQKYTIRSSTALAAVLIDSIKNVATRDSIADYYAENGLKQGLRYFEVYRSPIYIEGTFQKSYPWNIDFSKIAVDLNLEVAVLETKEGDWSIVAETGSSSITITDLKSKVVPYAKPWYKHIKAGIGMQAYKNGAHMYGAAGYKNWLGTVGYNERGTTLGVLYLF